MAVVQGGEINGVKGKGKGKATGKGNTGKGGTPFTGECWNCGVAGHRAQDCPEPAKGGGKDKGKGKGGKGGWQSDKGKGKVKQVMGLSDHWRSWWPPAPALGAWNWGAPAQGWGEQAAASGGWGQQQASQQAPPQQAAQALDQRPPVPLKALTQIPRLGVLTQARPSFAKARFFPRTGEEQPMASSTPHVAQSGKRAFPAMEPRQAAVSSWQEETPGFKDSCT